MLTNEQLLEVYDLVFTSVHSNGFKIAETKDLLYEPTYSFLEIPKKGWLKNIMSYFNSIGYDTEQLKMNDALVKYYSDNH